MLKDVLDGLKAVAEGIENVTTIAAAVKTGKEYVKQKHPEAQADIRALVTELGKSLLLVKRASAVLTNFRFAIDVDVQGSELARFNDYFVAAKTEAQHLRTHVSDLRTHCSKVRQHATAIAGAATLEGFAKFFALLGLHSRERELDLGRKLDQLAYEDFAVANSAEQMLVCLERALGDVQDALGKGGMMYSANIAAAASLLAAYGSEFHRMEGNAALAVREVQDLAQALD